VGIDGFGARLVKVRNRLVIPSSPTAEQDLKEFLFRWLQLLSDGKLQKACSQIDQPGWDGLWTPEKVMKIVNETFSPESRFYRLHPEGLRFTSPYGLREEKWSTNVYALDDGGFRIEQSIPLNGEWSDLSAIFEFRRTPDGYSVVLEDLDVL
jgi:hypothetical protein